MTPSSSRTAFTPTRRALLALALALALVTAIPALADSGFEFGVDQIDGDGWQARDIRVSVILTTDGPIRAEVLIKEASLPEPVGLVKGIQGRCDDLFIGTHTIRCAQASLTPGDRIASLPGFSGGFSYERDSGALSWDMTARPEPGGELRLSGAQRGTSWSIRVDTAALSAAVIAPLFTSGEDDAPELYGSLDVVLEARSAGDGFTAAYRGQAEGLGGSNTLGTSAADGVALTFEGHAHSAASGLDFDIVLDAPRGELYQEPVYVRLDDHPVELAARGQWSEAALIIENLGIEQPGVMSGNGAFELHPADASADQAIDNPQSEDTATGDPEDGNGNDDAEAETPPAWTVASGHLSLDPLILPGGYEVLMRPFLSNTDLGNMETSGSLRVDLGLKDDAPEAIDLVVENVFMDDRDGRLALYGLTANFAWARGRQQAAEAPVTIGWQGGFVYGIALDAARFEFAVEPGQWRLRQPTLIPFLGGGLALDALEIGDFTPGNARVAIDARLQPVSMLALTRALDWPPLSGNLSGVIPSMSYRDGALTFGGTLAAQMFDGEIRVSNFRLREPFNPGSRLEADIDIDGLDLKRVTEALSFGLITGKLDGYVKGLKMIDWSPVAFDARIFTPPGDKSRHRISQRAVDNIANLGGGGGAAALSKGFLRFFEDFSYSRIGLGCTLRYDTCEMSGIEPAGTGYYILRGSGLPQINVVGYSRRASWSTIVEQLKSIMESEGPVIE